MLPLFMAGATKVTRATLILLAVWTTMQAAGGSEGGAGRADPLWCVAAAGRGVPALDGSTVYFLTREHELVAVSRASGSVRWRVATAEAEGRTMGSRVVVFGGLIVVGDEDLLGFDREDGRLRWRFDAEDSYGAGIYLGDVLGGIVYAGSPSGRLHAVAIEDGQRVWSTEVVQTASSTVFQPVADDEVVAAGYSTVGSVPVGGVVVLDRATGQIRWRREFPRAAPPVATRFAGGPVLAAALVIVSSSDGSVHAYDRGTGRLRWSAAPVTRSDGRLQEQDWRALARSGPSILAGSLSGVLTAMDSRSGREQWRYAHPNGGSIGITLAADEESVYVPHFGGLLVALNSRDGSQRWQTGGLSDGFNWAPGVAEDRVYAAATKAGLCAFAQ